MAIWQSSSIETDGIHLHLTRTGGDKPPLLLAHGVTDNGLCWSPVASILAADYDVIMMDARGHGQSDAPATGYDLITLAHDLHGVVLALGLDRPVIMGHSLGAVTTLVMAGLYPATARSIVLEDPPAWWLAAPDAEFLPRAEGIRDWVIQLQGKTRAQIIAEGRAQNPLWSEAELEPWADSKLQVSADAMRKLFSSNHTAGLVWDDLLRRIVCPVMVVTADLSRGAALAPAGVEALRALVPQVQVAHIPGAGHSIRREQFDLYLEVVSGFLKGLPAANQ